jgi:hypothetical protein
VCARRAAAAGTRVSEPGSDALAITGLAWKVRIADRMAATAVAGVVFEPSASRSRRKARACSCDTRDSLTPSSAPISFIVTSPVVVERHHPLLADRQAGHRAAHAVADLGLLVERIGPLGLGRHQHGRQLLVIDRLGGRVWGGRLDGVDAHDGLAEALLVGADRRGEVGQRGFVAE